MRGSGKSAQLPAGERSSDDPQGDRVRSGQVPIQSLQMSHGWSSPYESTSCDPSARRKEGRSRAGRLQSGRIHGVHLVRTRFPICSVNLESVRARGWASLPWHCRSGPEFVSAGKPFKSCGGSCRDRRRSMVSVQNAGFRDGPLLRFRRYLLLSFHL